jgi:hypothetical protein
MMDFSEIKSSVVDQDKGIEIEILDPVDGKTTGIKFTVSGPDSETQRKASLAMMDELAEMADSEGRVSAEHRETARLNMLVRCVLGFKIKEDGKAIPFNHQNCVRVLKAGTWLQAQVDLAASDRSLFRKGE